MASQRERQRLRHLIAAEAVRLLSEGGLSSVDAARRKAAQRYGCADQRQWPEPAEVAAAWAERQRLFAAPGVVDHLQRLRRIARDVMALFAELDPELTDGLATGIADAHTPIWIRLHADAPEQVVFRLLDRRIPWQESERRLLFGAGRREARPAFRLRADGAEVELVVLRPADRADPPRDPGTGRPAPGVGLAELGTLLATTGPQPRSASGT